MFLFFFVEALRVNCMVMFHFQILLECRSTLLWCATPDAVIRLQDEWCSDVYFNQQQHGSLAQYLQASFSALEDNCLMVQVQAIDPTWFILGDCSGSQHDLFVCGGR